MIFSTLITTTKSPVSMWGVYVGRCLPMRIMAISLATRPTTLSVASTSHHLALSSPGLAMYVFDLQHGYDPDNNRSCPAGSRETCNLTIYRPRDKGVRSQETSGKFRPS